MTRSRVTAMICVVLIVLIGFYVARNTYWDEITYPLPPKGEALTNPFYAAQRFAEKLGATTVRQHALELPPPQSVIVLSVWRRRAAQAVSSTWSPANASCALPVATQ